MGGDVGVGVGGGGVGSLPRFGPGAVGAPPVGQIVQNTVVGQGRRLGVHRTLSLAPPPAAFILSLLGPLLFVVLLIVIPALFVAALVFLHLRGDVDRIMQGPGRNVQEANTLVALD